MLQFFPPEVVRKSGGLERVIEGDVPWLVLRVKCWRGDVPGSIQKVYLLLDVDIQQSTRNHQVPRGWHSHDRVGSRACSSFWIWRKFDHRLDIPC